MFKLEKLNAILKYLDTSTNKISVCLWHPLLTNLKKEVIFFSCNLSFMFTHFFTEKFSLYIILENFNEKIGKEAEYSRLSIIDHSLHYVSNDKETSLIDFVSPHNLLIKSTIFEQLKIYKETWAFNNGVARYQIDNVLVYARRSCNSWVVKILRESDRDTDHFLVKSKLRTRIPTQKPTRIL